MSLYSSCKNLSMNISVVIPTFNRSHTLKRAINSVMQQSLQVDEIIVVDDGSTDDTYHLMRKYPDVHYIQQENAGVSAARNSGIHHAHGDWVALLDSDDEWKEKKIELQTDMLISNPSYRLCHGNELWVHDGKHLNKMKTHKKRGGRSFK